MTRERLTRRDGWGRRRRLKTISGQVSIWEMDGYTRIGGGPVGPNPGMSWRTIGV